MDFKKILDSLLPFVIIGFGIALCIGLLFMFFSVAIWGVLIGGILWLATIAKNYFFPSEQKMTSIDEGRIIEHDDKK